MAGPPVLALDEVALGLVEVVVDEAVGGAHGGGVLDGEAFVAVLVNVAAPDVGVTAADEGEAGEGVVGNEAVRDDGLGGLDIQSGVTLGDLRERPSHEGGR